MKGSNVKCYLFVLVFFFITYGYFWQGGGSNQNARLYLAQAIINHGTFSIDNFREDSPDVEFVNLGDWAYYQGHYYSNKSPGLSFLMVPSVAVTQLLLNRFGQYSPERKNLICAYIGNLCTSVLLSAVLCLLIFRICRNWFKYSLTNSFAVTLSYGLGTLAFPYSTSLHSHQSAAFFSFYSFVTVMMLVHGSCDNKRRGNALALAAGAAAATSFLIEGSTILLLGVTAVYLVWFKTGRCYLAWFIAGALPVVSVLLYYNQVCFGSPFTSGYSYANPAVMLRIDGTLFGVPSLHTLSQLLVMPYRGMFYSSPVLLMALPGAYLLFKEHRLRVEAIFCLISCLLFFLFIASFHASYGGWAAGPRYLVPMYPWLFFLSIRAFDSNKKLFVVVSFVSVCLNLAITVVGTEIPSLIENPLVDAIFPALLAGLVSINPMPLSHYNDYPGMQMLSNPDNWPLLQNFNAFNLGELFFFASDVKSLIPLLVFWGGAALLWYKLVPLAASKESIGEDGCLK